MVYPPDTWNTERRVLRSAKPVSEVKFIQQVQRFLQTKSNELPIKNPDNFLLVKGGAKHKYLSIPLDKILYIKSMSNYIHFF
jgi:hypothetical protein